MILDNNDVLNEELISKWVSEVIHREVSKPDGEADLELIDECEKTLSCLNGGGLSEEELKKRLEKITGKSSYQAVSVHKLRAKSKRRIALAAACMVVVMLIGMVTAYATVPSFNDMIRGVLGMPIGSSVDDSEITFINDGKITQYSSLDGLINAEKLNDYGIIFPENLPAELSITSIEYSEYDDVKEVDILFSGGNEHLFIYMGRDAGVEPSTMQLFINGFVVYISEKEDVYASMMSYNNNLYCMTSANKDAIITIFEHMEKE